MSNAGLSLGGVVIACVMVEFGVRVLGFSRPHFYMFEDLRGWSFRPLGAGFDSESGAYARINSAGMHDVEHPVRKPPGTYRIAIIGDSMTAALEVPIERNFCSIAQSELARWNPSPGRRVEVLNFGVGGYGTAQELLTLRHQVWNYSPDFVVLAVYTENDLTDNSESLARNRCRPFYTIDQHGDLVLSGEFASSRPARAVCRADAWIQSVYVGHLIRQSDELLKAMLLPRTFFWVTNAALYQEPRSTEWRDAWEVTERLILQIRDEVRRHRVGFLVVTLSNGIQDYPDSHARRALLKRVGANQPFYPDDRIKALGDRAGFDVLTLAQPFQAYADTHHVFFHGFEGGRLGHGHWNESAHRLAGEILAAKLFALINGSSAAPAILRIPGLGSGVSAPRGWAHGNGRLQPGLFQALPN